MQNSAGKPELSLRKIINMSIGFLGIQMTFGLQNANASQILSNLGAELDKLSYFWLVAPLTGLIVQPIIGHLGDNTWGILGRRKPYFLIGAILTAFGMILLPNSSILVDKSFTNIEFIGLNLILWFAILFLAIMDSSINISMEPFRALVGDMLPKNQAALGFIVQTIIIGIGAVIGSWLPWILSEFGFSNTAEKGFVAQNIVISFYIGAFILISTIIYTIITIKEYSPEELEKFSKEKSEGENQKSSFLDIFKDFKNMPILMKKIGLIQFFSWFALFTMWVYTSKAISTYHFNLDFNDANSQKYAQAGIETGFLFGLYNGFAVPFAFLLIYLSKKTSRKFTHFLALFLGGLGLLSFYFIKDISYLWISMLGIGFAWASILSLPYAMLIDYIPVKKMGIYMGIFNFFIVIPQIINGLIGGFLVSEIFNNKPIYYIVIGGTFMILASLITLTIKEKSIY